MISNLFFKGFESFIEKQMAKIDDDSSDEIPKMPILPPEQHKFLPKFADYIEKVAAEVHEGRKIKCISVSHSPILKYTQVAINDEQGILTPVDSRLDYLNYLETVVCYEDMVFEDYFITDEGFAEINSWKENRKRANEDESTPSSSKKQRIQVERRRSEN